MITSVRLIQVGNNRNGPFKVLFRCPRPLNRGVHLIKASFKVNKGIGTSATVRLIEGVRLIRCPLNTGFTVAGSNLPHSHSMCHRTMLLPPNGEEHYMTTQRMAAWETRRKELGGGGGGGVHSYKDPSWPLGKGWTFSFNFQSDYYFKFRETINPLLVRGNAQRLNIS